MRSPDSVPTYGQLELAKKLGIDVVGKTHGPLQEEIDRVDKERGELALAGPALRLNNHVVYDGVVYIVESIRNTPQRRTVSLRPISGGRVRVIRASLLLGAEELDPELVKRLPHSWDINFGTMDELFPDHDDSAANSQAESSEPEKERPQTLLDAIQELTEVLREVSAKLDRR
jgi:hypothetical protein